MRDFVGDIRSEADRLQRITEELLRLTRLDGQPPLQCCDVPAGAVAERVVRMLRMLAEEQGVTLETDIDKNCVVRATEDDLYHILYNLVENAIKYNRRGGFVRLTLRREGGGTAIAVEDNGIGIPEEDLPKIFDRFYRVDKARSRAAGGTGLGLSIVRDTARRYGGAVAAARREGGGSVFTVIFPAPEEGAP